MNCSALLYSTRFKLKGDGIHWENAKGGCQNRTTPLLVYVVEGSKASHASLRRKLSEYSAKGGNRGGGDRPRPFIVIVIWAGIYAGQDSRKYRYKC